MTPGNTSAYLTLAAAMHEIVTKIEVAASAAAVLLTILAGALSMLWFNRVA